MRPLLLGWKRKSWRVDVFGIALVRGAWGSYCLGTETVLACWLFLLNVASHALESQLSLRCIPKVRPACLSKGGMLMGLRQGDRGHGEALLV